VCSGNVGRSQMAEGLHNLYYDGKSIASSAGLNERAIRRYHALPKGLIELMLEEGIDISGQRPKLLTEEIFEECDRCIVMCERDKCPDYIKDSGKAADKVDFWDIEDPYRKSHEEAREIRDHIKEKVRSLDITSSTSFLPCSRAEWS
jgi:arsenate reductase